MKILTNLAVLVALTWGCTAIAQTTKGIGDARRAAGATSGSGSSEDASSAGAGTGVGVTSGKGKLVVVNETPWAVVVRIGEAELGKVSAGGRQELTKIATGSRLVTVASEGGDRRWGPVEALVTLEGAELHVADRAETGIRILNHTTEPLVVLEGPTQVPVATIAAGADGVFSLMKPGTHKLGARSASGKLQYSARFLTVKEGQMTEWKVGSTPPGAR